MSARTVNITSTYDIFDPGIQLQKLEVDFHHSKPDFVLCVQGHFIHHHIYCDYRESCSESSSFKTTCRVRDTNQEQEREVNNTQSHGKDINVEDTFDEQNLQQLKTDDTVDDTHFRNIYLDVYVEMFVCEKYGETVHFTHVCDFKPHCTDRSDESFCVHPRSFGFR